MKATEHMLNTAKFAIYPDANTKTEEELMYLGLGLVDEAGEVAGKIKKLWRDGVLVKEDVAKELGDVYWYLHRICAYLDYLPEDIMQMNYEKLKDRQERNVLGGSGDNR